jgi:starch-binding outer membrane protein, SusD/RagB family
MKKFIWQKTILYAILVLFFSGCSEDYLKLSPVTTLTMDQFYKTQADYETAIMGVYYGWAEMTVRPMGLAELRSDNIGGNNLLYAEFTNNSFSLNGTNVFWGPYYQTVINPSSIIINTIDGVEMDAATKNRIKGEALFFRGWSYFWLNLWFEGVPLAVKPLTIEESFQLGRSTPEQTWAQVENDLKSAVSVLPTTKANYGRINKYDAETFLAKAYMQQKKWQEAKTLLADVFANSGRSLQPKWADLWSISGQQSSPELMLASIWNDNFPDDDMGQYVPIPSGGFRFVEVKSGLLESFEAGDIRKNETVDVISGQIWNYKYDFGYKVGVAGFISDVVVLRFTDVQLLYAEAITMAAGSVQQQSLDLINQVRKRVGLGDILMSNVPTIDSFTNRILAERRSEFVWECQRYIDLKRYGKLVEKVNATGRNFTENYNRIPIPQSEIDKMRGVLVQNPGY